MTDEEADEIRFIQKRWLYDLCQETTFQVALLAANKTDLLLSSAEVLSILVEATEPGRERNDHFDLSTLTGGP